MFMLLGADAKTADVLNDVLYPGPLGHCFTLTVKELRMELPKLVANWSHILRNMKSQPLL